MECGDEVRRDGGLQFMRGAGAEFLMRDAALVQRAGEVVQRCGLVTVEGEGERGAGAEAERRAAGRADIRGEGRPEFGAMMAEFEQAIAGLPRLSGN